MRKKIVKNFEYVKFYLFFYKTNPTFVNKLFNIKNVKITVSSSSRTYSIFTLSNKIFLITATTCPNPKLT